MDLAAQLPLLLGLAWLAPLASFVAILFFGPRMGHHGRNAAWVATAAIVTSLVLSLTAFVGWLGRHPVHEAEHGHHGSHAAAAGDAVHAADQGAAHGDDDGGHGAGHAGHAAAAPSHYAGTWYTLYRGGRLELSIGWYIDALTVLMFVMITFIATCIHVYASGYMHDELHDVTDHEVHVAGGGHLHRPGRYPRFFQALSLFCFSMLGIVIAGNVAMVFIFWELVGICSWFLIGFYFERKTASTAANKAFIVNRVGDFGMLIGLMALWGAVGTFEFADRPAADGGMRPGLFSLVRPASTGRALQVPDGMVTAAASRDVGRIVAERRADQAAAATAVAAEVDGWRKQGFGGWLLFIAGLGIFCGCVGKSAQFPLFVWLPDAMEGPTPVSALVHSATMVAAGVYLVGRFFPVLTPEVLLVIAYCGAITLFIAATIALVANDIKRVLAYSTVSQLGYMMLALGVGGWVAGLFHLVTHAFFKSLLFLCSGSVIHACHTNDMRKMGGLAKVMPATAGTMLVGCLAIIGAGIPFVIGLSGYYSKDAILAQALSFSQANPRHSILFLAVAGGAFLTAFYMFRLWFMTFAGTPRDHHVAEHAHESPRVMVTPLLVLAVLAVVAGWKLPGGFSVANMLEQARPAGTAEGFALGGITIPAEHESHEGAIHVTATLTAFATALGGVLLAAAMYLWRVVSPDLVRTIFRPVYAFLAGRWYFDELYHALFVLPAQGIAHLASWFDRSVIDGLIHGVAWTARQLAGVDAWIDRTVVDGFVNATANATWTAGLELKKLQTGRLRQYVMFIAVGTVALFVLAMMFLNSSVAG
ncbi:MAG: NADH-quinone oxidoreductase subunit L [Planctomycetia bacterium]|jgi:NADH:ubiquinone oxidoreductase subunit 5 (subunit L)/multisubunit Na+/H+ antiporter MnhA subunit